MYSSSSSVVRSYTLLAVVVQLLLLQCAVDYCIALDSDGPAVDSGSPAHNMDQFLNKDYKLDTSENFDELMKALGVGWLTRKAGSVASPTVRLTKNGNEYTLSSESTFKNTYTKFELGKEFDEETPDGRKAKSLITAEGNILTQVQKDENGKVTKMVRDFSPEQIKMIVTVDNIVSTRIYKSS